MQEKNIIFSKVFIIGPLFMDFVVLLGFFIGVDSELRPHRGNKYHEIFSYLKK